MSEEVDSLFVKLGIKADKDSFNESKALFGGLRRTALQFGAAIGTGVGLKSMTLDFATANRELGRFSELFSTEPQFVDNLAFAFDSITGNATSAFGAIQRVADIIEQTEWGEIPSDAFREVGFDPMLLQGVESMAEAFERLSGATSDMEPENARRALRNLGFGPEAIQVFRAEGDESLERLLARGGELRTITDEQVQASKDFQRASAELSRVFQSFLDEWSTGMLFGLTEALERLTTTMEDNREAISSSIDIFREIGDWIAGMLAFIPGIERRNDETLGDAFERRHGREAPTPIRDGMQNLLPWLFNDDDEDMDDIERLNRLLESGSPAAGEGRVIREDASSRVIQDNRRFEVVVNGGANREQARLGARQGMQEALQQAAENSVLDLRGDLS